MSREPHWHNPETGQIECECCCEAALDFKTLRDSLRSLSNEAAGMLGYGGQALRDLLGNTNCAVLESKINDARVVLVMTGPERKRP